MVKQIKSIFTDKEIVEQGLRQLFIISSSSHFFNEIDLKQYLFNFDCHVIVELLRPLFELLLA